MLTVEQVMASHKANIETLFGLTNKAFEGVEKIVELNLAASKAALSDASSHTQSLSADQIRDAVNDHAFWATSKNFIFRIARAIERAHGITGEQK